MAAKKYFNLFEVAGIELEYMIVDRDSLRVMPIADQLLRNKSGQFVSDVNNRTIDWSNELVNHVIELKTHNPVCYLNGSGKEFADNVIEINQILESQNAMLLSSGTHPFMDPAKETRLWQHEYQEIYAIYDNIFNCNSHGWSNLQCMHLNLPFSGDEEFAKLHTAIRILLPIIPALAASSPIREGKMTGFIDSRMEAYLHHQANMPSLMGKLIPEPVLTEEEYYRKIFEPIKRDIKPYDVNHIMEHQFLNSRGAIARFDRNAIEIRVIDLQECPDADVAIAALIIEVLKLLVNGVMVTFEDQLAFNEDFLFDIFNRVIRDGDNTRIENHDYLKIFGISEKKVTAMNIWKKLFHDIESSLEDNYKEMIGFILTDGSLSYRILRRLNGDVSHNNVVSVYRKIAECLATNKMLD